MRYNRVNGILTKEIPKEHRTLDQPERRKIHNPPYIRLLQWLLYAIAILAFTWPVYRAFLNIEITDNEAWNAYFADAAMGKMPLYPSTAQLITNNYPPLSFYIVGLAGRLIGDPVLAGRLLSLISVIAIATAIALSVRRLGGTQAAAVISAAFYIAMMSRFFRSYVGLNEPQLLSHAIMAFGFLAFLGARSRDRGYVMPVLVMAFAGFVKHNIIAMPLTAFAWLGMNRRREALKCLCVAAVVIVTGIAICYVSFGRDFFLNILAPRHYSLKKAIRSFKDLQWVSVGLVACVCNGCARWHDRSVRLCTGLIAIALAAFFLERTGAGVWTSAQFDLVIAVAIGLGLAYTQVPLWPLARRFPPAVSQAILLLVVCARLLVPKELEPIRLLVDRRFKNEIAIREQAMADSVERVRETPGDVLCPALISYRAGKPFAVDKFNAKQRMSAGAFRDAVTARVAAGTLTIVKTDPRARWTKPFRVNPVPPAELKKWDVWVGDWTLSGTAKDTPTGPEYKVNWYLHGHWIVNGFFVQVDQTWKGNGQELNNMEIFSYDPVKKIHTVSGFSGDGWSWALTATFDKTTTTEEGVATGPDGAVVTSCIGWQFSSDGKALSGTQQSEQNGVRWTAFTVKGTKSR